MCPNTTYSPDANSMYLPNEPIPQSASALMSSHLHPLFNFLHQNTLHPPLKPLYRRDENIQKFFPILSIPTTVQVERGKHRNPLGRIRRQIFYNLRRLLATMSSHFRADINTRIIATKESKFTMNATSILIPSADINLEGCD